MATWAGCDMLEAAKFQPVSWASLIVSTLAIKFSCCDNLYLCGVRDLLEEQQVPVLDHLPVGGLCLRADCSALLTLAKVIMVAKMSKLPSTLPLTSTSKSGKRLTRAVSRLISSSTLIVVIIMMTKTELHLVDAASQEHVVVDQISQGGLLRSTHLLHDIRLQPDGFLVRPPVRLSQS